MTSVQQVTVIKLIPQVMRGKYKLGQQWAPAYRLKMANNIVNREGKEIAAGILDVMGIETLGDGNLKIKVAINAVHRSEMQTLCSH